MYSAVSLSEDKRNLLKVAHESKERLLLRSLRKDRLKLYEKIGREVEQLILTGDIEHPRLEKRISKIREIEQEIEDVETRVANQHMSDEKIKKHNSKTPIELDSLMQIRYISLSMGV